jgi:hypothetical protein
LISQSRGLGDVYKRQLETPATAPNTEPHTTTFAYQIPPGAYTLTTLVETLNYLKNHDPGCGCYASLLTFSGDETTGRVSLSISNPHRVMFHKYYTFGIDHDVQGADGNGQWVVTTPQPVRLNTPTVLFLSFTNIRAIGSGSDIEVHSNLFGHVPGHAEGHVPRGCIIARLQLTAGQWNINYLGSENRIYLRSFRSGALNLDHLNIVFTDPLGRLIDFNGADHSLFLRIAYEAS